MSAKTYVENVGMIVKTRLFGNDHSKYLLMEVDLQDGASPVPQYKVYYYNARVIKTPNLTLALETYDNL